MLTELRLENFKCFGGETVVPCGRLNLLTGVNSKGKSTTLQALLILHQSLSRMTTGEPTLQRVELNGGSVRLGTFREIQNSERPTDDRVRLSFEFSDELEAGGHEITVSRLQIWQADGKERWASLTSVEVERFVDLQVVSHNNRQGANGHAVALDFALEPDGSARDTLARSSHLYELGQVYYVGADRLGPQDFFPWSNSYYRTSVGVRGERTPEVLYRAEQEQQQVHTQLLRSEAASTVPEQASAWLSYIFDGGAVRVGAESGVVLTVEMNADGSARYFRAVHLGFGYSYVLPILVASLVAPPGSILIVENPEAHLHPFAQSRMGEFLALVAQSGVQVFVESHSEHVLNAFRLAVREQHLATEDLAVLYFRRDAQEPVLRVAVEADGRITDWPDGFFDQRTRDFLRLFGE